MNKNELNELKMEELEAKIKALEATVNFRKIRKEERDKKNRQEMICKIKYLEKYFHKKANLEYYRITDESNQTFICQVKNVDKELNLYDKILVIYRNTKIWGINSIVVDKIKKMKEDKQNEQN